MAQDRRAVEAKRHRRDNWLVPGIVVKVMNNVVGGGKYYKKKGLVLRVIDRFIGELRMSEDGDIIRIDQAQVETVIPKVRLGGGGGGGGRGWVGGWVGGGGARRLLPPAFASHA